MELREQTRCAACGRIGRCAVGLAADATRGVCAECAFGVCTVFALFAQEVEPPKQRRCAVCERSRPAVSALDVADPLCGPCAAGAARFLASALNLSEATRGRLAALADAVEPPPAPPTSDEPEEAQLAGTGRRRARRKTELHCSFCGRHQSEVQKLIAGPEVFICDACVDDAVPALEAGQGASGARCSFCAKPDLPSFSNTLPTADGRTVRICSECVALCADVLAEARRPA